MIGFYFLIAWTLLGAIGVLGLNARQLDTEELIHTMGTFALLGPYGFYVGLRCYFYNRSYRRKGDRDEDQ